MATVFKSHISNQEINSRENPHKSRLFLEFQEFVGPLIMVLLVRNEIRALREISRKNLSPTNRVWNSILVACARERRRGGQYLHRQRGEGDFATEEIFSPPPNVYMRKQSEREICLVLSTQLYFGFSTQQQIDDGTTKFLWSLEAASRYSLSGLQPYSFFGNYSPSEHDNTASLYFFEKNQKINFIF